MENQLLLRPYLMTWQFAALGAPILTAGRALLLQVAHPAVGAGVHEYSSFQQDPWQRLERTLQFYRQLIFATETEAEQLSSQLRHTHQKIAGTTADGVAYAGTDPQLYQWVHWTLADSIVQGIQRFRGPVPDEALEVFWREQLAIARVLGIDTNIMPSTWTQAQQYGTAMMHEQLQRTAAVDDVLESMHTLPAPIDNPLLVGLWPSVTAGFRSLTTGLLPPLLRDRFDLPYTSRERAVYHALTTTVGTAIRIVPYQWTSSSQTRTAWRSIHMDMPLRRRHLQYTQPVA